MSLTKIYLFSSFFLEKVSNKAQQMTAQNMLTKITSGRVLDYSHTIGQYMGGMDWPGYCPLPRQYQPTTPSTC